MTATIMPSPDLETIMLPDDVELIPCESKTHDPAVAARWVLVCRSCNETNLACTPHKERLDQEADWGYRIVCAYCDTDYVAPLPWVRI